MNSTQQGNAAESAVANLLAQRGFVVISRNWKRASCEIDIIAKKDRIIYFVEVKYRSSQGQGDGFDYITPKKLTQMKKAGLVWVHENNWSGDYRLMAASVSGLQCENLELIELD